MSIHFLVCCLTVLASCQRARPGEVTIEQELSDSLALIGKTADFNGFGVAIVGPEGVRYSNGFGLADVANNIPYTENTVQPIASISKTFIGLAVMKAQELGKLKLDDPVSNYVPFSVVNPHHPEVPITIRHLATHTSSLVDTDDYLHRSYVLADTTDLATHLAMDVDGVRFSPPAASLSMEEFLRNYLAKDGAWYSDSAFLSTKPGERFSYSNIGATLAALVVETAVGTPFDRFTQQYVLDPLGMRASGWHVEGNRDTLLTVQYQDRTSPYPRYRLITYPDGGFAASAADMAKYMAELVKGHRGEGILLSKVGYAEYFREQLTDAHFDERSTGMFGDHTIGIFISFDAHDHVGHTGGDPGTMSMLFIERKTGLGRYFIVNTDLEGYQHHIKVWELLGRYAEKLDQRPQP